MRFSVFSSLFALAATGSAAVIGKGKGPGGPAPAAVKPDILLVPGAWHQPQAFDLIREQLTCRGFESTAVPLVTVGPTDPLNQGVPEDAAAIRAALEKLVNAGKEVMVISHSYGGVPAAAAVEGLNLKDRVAQGKKGGVLMVVHMTSFAAKVGTSLMDSLGGKPLPWFNITGDILTPIDPTKVFYADVEPKLAAESVKQILPSSLRAMTDKGTFAPWDAGFQMGFIHTEDDQAIPIAIQKQMAAQFPAGSFSATLKSSHSPFLSMPEKLGEVIEQASVFAKKP
ncbi:hypothetical protein PG995_010877 [Apiospora arundinis]|uniref:Alpha/beta hydrolase fold-1 n=1 Tax=Apiospora arundinis TaxID=335852 RepID=A0ABR2IQN7_9PEZI